MTVMATRGALPPVAVECAWCDSQFLSRARDQMPVHCPRCKRSVRVKRYGGESAPLVCPFADAPAAVKQSAPAPDPCIDDDDDPDDGGTTFTYHGGQLVLGEWTADGRLVPAMRNGAIIPAERANGRLIPAAPVSYTAGLAARHWEIRPNPAGPARCHVLFAPPPGAPAGTHHRHCLGLVRHDIPGGAICDNCHDALSRPIVPAH
jgi:hypothetical protein